VLSTDSLVSLSSHPTDKKTVWKESFLYMWSHCLVLTYFVMATQ